MHYLSYIPENITSHTKCIIMLHGVWSNEEDLFALKGDFGDDIMFISLQWPFSLGSGRYAWYPVDFSTGKPIYRISDVERGYSEIMACIEEVGSKYEIPPESIFLLGFSQGAIMSYYTLSRSPEKIGGIIALSGRLLSEIAIDDIDIDQYREKKVFIGHGVHDSVIPLEATRVTSAFIRSFSIEPTVKFYDAPHTITEEERSDIRSWIASI